MKLGFLFGSSTGRKSEGHSFTSLHVNTNITLQCYAGLIVYKHFILAIFTCPLFSYRQLHPIPSPYLTLKSNPAVAIDFAPTSLLLLAMKLTSTVNLWCHLSFVLAAKAMSSNLLPEYQHGYLHHGNASILSSPTNTSANVSLLLAPSYRNVTAGGAWILPASPFDLGARAMTCECFDPDGTYLVLLRFIKQPWLRMLRLSTVWI